LILLSLAEQSSAQADSLTLFTIRNSASQLAAHHLSCAGSAIRTHYLQSLPQSAAGGRVELMRASMLRQALTFHSSVLRRIQFSLNSKA